ncbi:MAG TPA: right-handed parallel beta-helix repeat-containing protein [Longimicrobiales bacterium]
MTGTLFFLAAIGAACQDSGFGGLAPCEPGEAGPPTATVADPVAVPEHLLHPPAEALDPLSAILYDDTVSVLEYGVRADGSTDNTAALQRAIDEVAPGTALFFPKAEAAYVLRGTVELRSDVGLISDGATIDTRDNDGTALELDGVSGVEISGLRFRGPTTPDTYSRAITIADGSTGNLVRDAYFRYYSGGAVVVQGSENTIRDNTFVEVNNSPPEPGAHYGSIHLLTGDRNVIVGNTITDFDWSGISLYASDDNRIAENVVRTREGFPGASMGIYILAGSSGNLVERNDVSLARNECIVLISNSDVGPVEGNVVRNNHTADCPYAGISLQKNGDHDVSGNLVEDNRVEAFGLGDRHIDHAILLVGARDNIVRRNEVRSDGSQIETGIRTMDHADGNVFEANAIEGVSGSGIVASGKGSRYVGNTIRDAEFGIFMASAPDAEVTGNAVSETERGTIRVGSDVDGARIYDNRLDAPVEYSPDSGVTVRDNIVTGCR